MLERFMKINLSESVKLSRLYTNHSIRVTVITNLDNAGFEACHIIQLSSHKSESTIKEYAPKCSDSKKKEMFQSLSNAMLPKKSPTNPTSTIAKLTNMTNTTPDIHDVKQNLPNFTLDPVDYDTIDDSVLANLLTDFAEDAQNTNSNNNNALSPEPNSNVPVTQHKQQFNTQVINQNVPFGIPRMPVMYFPNSNVTINYNFTK